MRTPHVMRARRATQYATRLLALLLTACGTDSRADRPPDAADDAHAGTVVTGIDRLLTEGAGPLSGLRVGLITNHTGVAADGRSTIDALAAREDLDLVALFGPEHGLRGIAEAGERIEDGHDVDTGLPVHSLYGDVQAPTPQMLDGLDALAFDIQDIGTRYYTYVWTMALAMRAAADAGLRFVVLDRPDPIGGALVQGNVLDPEFATLVGLYPVPMRHGLTAGELARFLNGEFGIGADLHVVEMQGWRRDRWYDATGLAWRAPSPNMPDLESAAHYPGTCLFEGTNLSVGRGTPIAFQQIGAPWLDAEAVADRLAAEGLPGVRIEPVRFTPQAPGDGKFPDTDIAGLRFVVTDRARYDPTRTAVATLVAIRDVHGDALEFLVRHFDRLAGTDALRTGLLAGQTAAELTASWAAQEEGFRARRRPYLLYP